LVVDSLLEPFEVNELQQITDEFVARSATVSSSDEIFDLEPGHTSASPKLRRLKKPHIQHAAYRRLLDDQRILDLVEQLIGPGIRFEDTKLNLKSAEIGSLVAWHQDWAFCPHTNDDVLAVGIALDDMTAQNGCLMVVPGSHRGPTLDHHENGVFVGAISGSEVGSDAVPIELHAGGMSVHHTRLVHGSAPNLSPNSRRFLLFEYASADSWPLVGLADDWSDHHDRLLRGEEVLEPRMESLHVRLPLPRAERAGSIYEIQSQRREATQTN